MKKLVLFGVVPLGAVALTLIVATAVSLEYGRRQVNNDRGKPKVRVFTLNGQEIHLEEAS